MLLLLWCGIKSVLTGAIIAALTLESCSKRLLRRSKTIVHSHFLNIGVKEYINIATSSGSAGFL